MVDYSKWNKFEVEDSEDEEEPKQMVTKLEDNTSVRIGPNGPEFITNHAAPSNCSDTNINAKGKSIVSNVVKGETNDYKWEQNRYEVVVKMILKDYIKGSKISLSCHEKVVSIRMNEAIIFERTLAYGVHEVDKEGDSMVEWELQDNDSDKLLVITFKKKSPIENAIQWWSCVFVGDPQIDVTTIPGRSTSQNAWEEAHAMFRERMKDRQSIPITTESSEIS